MVLDGFCRFGFSWVYVLFYIVLAANFFLCDVY